MLTIQIRGKPLRSSIFGSYFEFLRLFDILEKIIVYELPELPNREQHIEIIVKYGEIPIGNHRIDIDVDLKILDKYYVEIISKRIIGEVISSQDRFDNVVQKIKSILRIYRVDSAYIFMIDSKKIRQKESDIHLSLEKLDEAIYYVS